jgi:cyclophilin family peptidyl-prolyl cis-trans isomerase
MRRLSWSFHSLFRKHPHRRQNLQKPKRRLELEALEDRCVPSANASGIVTGFAYVDSNSNGVHDSQDFGVTGVVVSLTGKTNIGANVSVTATTDGQGSFTFQSVQPGTYQLAYTPVANLLGGLPDISGGAAASGVKVVANFTVAGGQTVNQDLGFTGLDPHFISGRMFLTSTTAADYGLAAAGGGTGAASLRDNSAPFLAHALPTVAGIENGSNLVDLAGFFSDPDITNTTAHFTVTAGNGNSLGGTFDVQLLDTQAPQTVANFLDYVNSGAYTNSIFHRLVTSPTPFVLQGGGFTLSRNPTAINSITALPPVPSEFSTPNTKGTLAMALPGNNINGGTDEFFFNLADNSSTSTSTNLDAQDFTVFGTASDTSVIDSLATATVRDESSTNPALSQLPLVNFTGTKFPQDASTANFEVITNIAASPNESLRYSVVSNSNPGLVSTNLQNEKLTLNYTKGMTGSAVITVKATDDFGASVTSSFTVNVTVPPPVVTGVTIAPNSATAATALNTTVTAQDANGDTQASPNLTLAYQWLRNGAPIAGATNPSLDLTKVSGLVAGDTLSVRVTPSDSSVAGTAFTSKAVTVAATSPGITFATPTVASVTIAPDNPAAATLLKALPVSNDGTAVSFAYQWFQNSSAISGQTSQTLDLNSSGLSVKSGDKFTVKVTPSDATGTGTALTSNAVTVTNVSTAGFPTTYAFSAPAVTSVLAKPDNAAAVTTLTAMPTASGSSVTFTYQWQQNGINIPNATDQTLNLLTQVPAVNVTDWFTVQVTPSDGTTTGATFNSKNVIIRTVKPITVGG